MPRRWSSKGDPSGLGPIPPKGGVREEFTRLAFVRKFPSSSCSGGKTNRLGLYPEVCTRVSGDTSWQFSAVMQSAYNLTNNVNVVTGSSG